MKTTLPTEIKSIEEAKSFLTDLFNNNEGFHPEDDANDVIWNLPEEEKPSKEDCDKLNELMGNIYDLEGNEDYQNMAFDPCGFILENFAY